MVKDYYYERRLPHFFDEGSTYFVTFRLHGSIPVHVIAELMAEKANAEKLYEQGMQSLKEALKQNFYRYEKFLDNSPNGPYYLSEIPIANIVKDAIFYQADKTYKLHAFCVMSNHVHMLITTLPNAPLLYKILGSLKRHTSRQANILLGRTGLPFWAEESYDRMVRRNGEFYSTLSYILENPVKAGIVGKWRDWPHTYVAIDPSDE